MSARPKINLTLSPLDKALEMAGVLLLIILWGLTIFAYFRLPDTIPIHFNSEGKVDNYGSKITLFFTTGLGTLIFFSFRLLNNYPHIFNYLKNITETNAEKQYTYATRLIRYMKVAVLFIMILVTLLLYLAALGKTSRLEFWFLPLVFILFFIPTGYYVFKSLKAK